MKSLSDIETVDLIPRINGEHRLVLQSARTTLSHAHATGLLLEEAKRRISHGCWEGWIERNCEFSVRVSQQYRQLADCYPDGPPRLEEHLSIQDAITAGPPTKKQIAAKKAREERWEKDDSPEATAGLVKPEEENKAVSGKAHRDAHSENKGDSEPLTEETVRRDWEAIDADTIAKQVALIVEFYEDREPLRLPFLRALQREWQEDFEVLLIRDKVDEIDEDAI